ncbi:hypothetical protein LXA43DRAFT_1187670 [Ganoderma leucocontextum]|nr:hypothetical protein LXA43DRAFT_1187670 [Ganoderma leucocontextum]
MIYYFAIAENFQLVNADTINCEMPPTRLLALHRSHLKKGDLEINVILSATASPLELIAVFWATQVQNILTPDFICVSYPALNEGDVALLVVNTQFPSGKTLDLIPQWAATYPTGVRFFGDKHCLLLHMSPVGVRANRDGMVGMLQNDNVFWWRGGYVCSAACGWVGMRVWPGILLKGGSKDREAEAEG